MFACFTLFTLVSAKLKMWHSRLCKHSMYIQGSHIKYEPMHRSATINDLSSTAVQSGLIHTASNANKWSSLCSISSAFVALAGLSSPRQCSSTAPQAVLVCDTKAHSHPSPEPKKWHMHGCRCRFTSCLLKYEAISCEWCMVRESGRPAQHSSASLFDTVREE